jgi:Flp pilus assembly protein TadB
LFYGGAVRDQTNDEGGKMVEGLISVLILAFVTLIFGLIKELTLIIIPQIVLILVVIYLLIRVRVKISRAEKEKLRAKIEELEKKIESLAK